MGITGSWGLDKMGFFASHSAGCSPGAVGVEAAKLNYLNGAGPCWSTAVCPAFFQCFWGPWLSPSQGNPLHFACSVHLPGHLFQEALQA